ncbi:MAG: hypothetical protein ACOYNY_04125 [Caldilineaceae bacterium]
MMRAEYELEQLLEQVDAAVDEAMSQPRRHSSRGRRTRSYRCRYCNGWQGAGPGELCANCQTNAIGGPPTVTACEHCGNWRRVGEACAHCNRGSAREFEMELRRAANQAEAMARRTPTPEEITASTAAQERGAALVAEWIAQLERSNPSGTAVRAQARIRAGAQLQREAKAMARNDPQRQAYQRLGARLILRGRADLHPDRRGGGARELEAMAYGRQPGRA